MAGVNYGLYPHGLPADTIKLMNGVRLHYRTSEAGQIPVVFVHGYSLSSVVWEKVQILLPPRYRSIAIDLRGFGQSDKPDEGYGYDDLVEDLAEFLRYLKIRQAVFVGHAFGAMLLQHFAVRYPDRVLALVLTSSGAAALPPKGLDDDVRESISRYGTKEENRALFEAAVPRYFDALNVTLEDLDNFVETALLATNPALRGTLETLYASPPISREEYAAIKTPTLIIVGTHDPFGTFDQAVVLSDVLPKSKITVMARCGHSPMWEKPIEFVKVLADFLEDNGLK